MSKSKFTKGFTLVELVVGIVVLAIAMMIMNTMLISQSKDALEPMYRLRASQLGQSIMQNILSRAYDQNSDHNGGYYRCGEIWGDVNLWYNGSAWVSSGTPTEVSCTAVANYGPDTGESDHPDFNDVDDFITTGFVSAVDYGNVLGDDLGGSHVGQYSNYQINIDVSTDSSLGFVMKKVTVTVNTPSNENIRFSALKGNY